MYYELGFGESLAGTSDGCSRLSFRMRGTSHKRRFGLRNHLNDCFHCYGWDLRDMGYKWVEDEKKRRVIFFDMIGFILCFASPSTSSSWELSMQICGDHLGEQDMTLYHTISQMSFSEATEQHCPTMRDRIQSWSISPLEETLPITLPVGLGCRSLT